MWATLNCANCFQEREIFRVREKPMELFTKICYIIKHMNGNTHSNIYYRHHPHCVGAAAEIKILSQVYLLESSRHLLDCMS